MCVHSTTARKMFLRRLCQIFAVSGDSSQPIVQPCLLSSLQPGKVFPKITMCKRSGTLRKPVDLDDPRTFRSPAQGPCTWTTSREEHLPDAGYSTTESQQLQQASCFKANVSLITCMSRSQKSGTEVGRKGPQIVTMPSSSTTEVQKAYIFRNHSLEAFSSHTYYDDCMLKISFLE